MSGLGDLLRSLKDAGRVFATGLQVPKPRGPMDPLAKPDRPRDGVANPLISLETAVQEFETYISRTGVIINKDVLTTLNHNAAESEAKFGQNKYLLESYVKTLKDRGYVNTSQVRAIGDSTGIMKEMVPYEFIARVLWRAANERLSQRYSPVTSDAEEARKQIVYDDASFTSWLLSTIGAKENDIARAVYAIQTSNKNAYMGSAPDLSLEDFVVVGKALHYSLGGPLQVTQGLKAILDDLQNDASSILDQLNRIGGKDGVIGYVLDKLDFDANEIAQRLYDVGYTDGEKIVAVLDRLTKDGSPLDSSRQRLATKSMLGIGKYTINEMASALASVNSAQKPFGYKDIASSLKEHGCECDNNLGALLHVGADKIEAVNILTPLYHQSVAVTALYEFFLEELKTGEASTSDTPSEKIPGMPTVQETLAAKKVIEAYKAAAYTAGQILEAIESCDAVTRGLELYHHPEKLVKLLSDLSAKPEEMPTMLAKTRLLGASYATSESRTLVEAFRVIGVDPVQARDYVMQIARIRADASLAELTGKGTK
ncbi:TPA: hypothetical protein HA246_06820 [Candidatus Woesearchaeota archaeon]|nr:hypothetical protein [Candidatus Woesearchaeota archaeon]